MYLNNFSVRIVGGKEQSGGYVEMEHGKQYSLALRNDRSVECDAYVEIDGKHVGTWRIWANRSITLERPEHDQSRFTFYQVGTSEAAQAQLQEGDPNLGLVKVTFTPAKAVKPLKVKSPKWVRDPGAVLDWGGDTWTTVSASSTGGTLYAYSSTTTNAGSVPCSDTAANYSAGGTGLSGHSNQQFYQVPDIDPNLSQQTVIHLRLVAAKQDGQARPLTTYSTPVPPPVP